MHVVWDLDYERYVDLDTGIDALGAGWISTWYRRTGEGKDFHSSRLHYEYGGYGGDDNHTVRF